MSEHPADRKPSRPAGRQDGEQPQDDHPRGIDEQSAETVADHASQELTPEEQLARYEESLKNDDWGHQPC